MKKLARYALSMGAAIVFFAGCGRSQPPIGTPGALPQTIASAPSRTTGHRMTVSSYQVLYDFQSRSTGKHPAVGLLDVNGKLYGTTTGGGSYSKGTVYSVTRKGVEKVLHSFAGGSDGALPNAALIDVKGTLYGTTTFGGSANLGTVYSVTTTGAEKVLYSFAGLPFDGYYPYAGLTDVNGTLYGTTYQGGSGFGGTVYSITMTGIEKVLYNFYGGSNAISPLAGLVAVNGTLYGTSPYGGSIGPGTVYSVTTAGDEKVLYSFGKGTDGVNPDASLIDVKGTLYGTTPYGGSANYGTVYSVTTTGVEKVLYNFTNDTTYRPDGAIPNAALIDMKGTLYGTTTSGGLGSCRDDTCGTVYSISTTGAEKVLHEIHGRLRRRAPADRLGRR